MPSLHFIYFTEGTAAHFQLRVDARKASLRFRNCAIYQQSLARQLEATVLHIYQSYYEQSNDHNFCIHPVILLGF